MPEGMRRTGKHKGIREKREEVKVLFERLPRAAFHRNSISLAFPAADLDKLGFAD
jgi:hypothetical protein